MNDALETVTSPAEPLASRLDSAVAAGIIRPLDASLARWMASRHRADAESAAATALLLSMARRDGHTGIRLDRLDDDANLQALVDAGVVPADLDLRTALAGASFAGAASDGLPVVREGDALFLRRYWTGDARIAESVRRRIEAVRQPENVDELAGHVRRLFGEAGAGSVDWQAVAAIAALNSGLVCVAGGPGTGKTTTVVRMLALLLASEPRLRIALAAPTGKAANRLAESVSRQVSSLDVDDEIRERIPAEASTLHRLLGYQPSRARFASGPERPLGVDVLVVDEASMIDHQLFDAMLRALPTHARLILLGDPDQLASVDAGFVFGDLCRAGAGEGFGEDFVRLAERLGVSGLSVSESASPLRDSVVTLRHTYRFGADSGIGALSRAFRDADADAVAAVFETARADVRLLEPEQRAEQITRFIRPAAERMLRAATPEEALEALDAARVLSPVRVGPHGVIALNAEIEAWLLAQGLRPPGEHYRGRPILVTANDYDVGLFNGDVGVLWNDRGQVEACFPQPGGIRRVSLGRLPEHEVAWAMTVHKSQGSEFDEVLLVLPEAEHETMLTRELLYTAITRARQRALILGDLSVLRRAAIAGENRVTGLAARLTSSKD